MEKKCVFLIDDDESFLAIAEQLLKGRYNIIKEKSAEEALNKLSQGINPHIVLLDIIMPDLDGWETFKRIRLIEHMADIPIVFLTSVDTVKEKLRAIEVGASDYITKPFRKDDVINRIEKIISEMKSKKRSR